MHVRPADATELEAIAALFEEVDAFHRERLPGIFRAPDGPARSDAYLRDQLAGPDTAILLAEDEGLPLGLVHVVMRDVAPLPLFVPRRYGLVDCLVVAARARRRGVGRALMAAAHTWVRERGGTAIELTVYDANPEALAFYRALGYRVLQYRLAAELD